MTTKLCCEVLQKLKEQGLSLATAESCTGGGIGASITAIPGSSAWYKGGIISYTNEIKERLLGVDSSLLLQFGAVSGQVAESMALGAIKTLGADVAVSVTGLAGPDGDSFGNPVGTVFIGVAKGACVQHRKFLFSGDRQQVRQQAVEESLKLLLENI